MKANLGQFLKQLPGKFIESFRTAFPAIIWLIFTIVVSLGLAVVLLSNGFEEIPESRDSLFYSLSAQSQTLGAILALVFTITLIVAQLATRYSHILLDRVLGPWAFWYAVPFGTAIVLPLFLLNGEFYIWANWIALILGSWCILLLIPYFVAIRRLLSISGVILGLAGRISSSNSLVEIRESTKSIANIAMGALNLRDYETFEYCVDQMEMLGGSEINNCANAEIVGHEIRDLVLRVRDDKGALRKLVSALGNILEAIQSEDPPSSANKKLITCLADAHEVIPPQIMRNDDNHIVRIKSIGNQALLENDIEIARECMRVFHAIAARELSADFIDVDGTKPAIAALGEMATNNLTRPDVTIQPSPPINSAIRRLEDIGKKAKNRLESELQESTEVQLSIIIDNSNGELQVFGNIARAALSSIEAAGQS